MKFIIAFILCWNCFFLNGQNENIQSKKYTAEELQEDFRFWRNSLEQKHPLIYLYHSKEEVDSTFNSAYNSIIDNTSEIEFYILLSKIASYLSDGHNGLTPSLSLIDSFVNCKYLLPLEVQIQNEKLFIHKNLSGSRQTLCGKELISINGIAMSDILEELMSVVTREGKTPFYKSKINNLFRFYYHLSFGVNEW